MTRALRRSLGPAVALLLAAAPAIAGGRITTAQGALPDPAYADSLGAYHLPDPGVAQRLSLKRTAVPFAIGTAAFALDVGLLQTGFVALGGYAVATVGLVAGPSAGYSYGGLPGRGAVGVGARLALVVGVPVAFAIGQSDEWGDENELAAIALGLVAGAGLAAISGVWDIAAVPGDVERNNRRLLQQARVNVEPALTPFARAPGLAVRVGLGPRGS